MEDKSIVVIEPLEHESIDNKQKEIKKSKSIRF